MNLFRTTAAVTVPAVAALALAGCVANDAETKANALSVDADDSQCAIASAQAQSGTVAFDITNSGSQVTEFYLLADDGLRIVGEVENIAPGASRTLTVTAQPGNYFTLCKPGMVGEGVGRAAFSVTGDAVEVDGPDAELKQQAVDLYAGFVKDQVEGLVPAAQSLTDAYVAGDDESAREQFPSVRAFYERIEPVAESLGDLDPRIDYREVDAIAEGLDWTGFHRIEKDLWEPAKDASNSDGSSAWTDWEPSTSEQRAEFAQLLNDDIQELYDYVHSDDFQTALDDQGAAGISNGAIGLLDEVANGKITGEEAWWSGTDMWDFAANVEGSEMAYSLVKDLAQRSDDGKDLAAKIEDGYAALKKDLANYGSLSDGFVSYSEITDDDRRLLTDDINALAEPLSQLTATILE